MAGLRQQKLKSHRVSWFNSTIRTMKNINKSKLSIEKFNELTIEWRSKTEHIIQARLLVTMTIVSDARLLDVATTGMSGFGNGILHCAVIQPSSITPVQAILKGLKQLIIGGDTSTLFRTRLLSCIKV